MNLTYEALFDATVTILTGSGLQETAAGQVAERAWCGPTHAVSTATASNTSK